MENDRTNIDLVKERSDIVTLVEKYVNLKQTGQNYTGLCPFHNEKTASFNVNQQLQIYKCFGCGKSGDVIKFIEEIEKIDFPQALEKLAKDAGIQLKKRATPLLPAMQINEWAKIYFQKELYSEQNKEALEYVKSRGITEKQIKEFGIGYAPGNINFLNRLRSYKNYSTEILIDSGLFVIKNGVLKERFNKRVMFSIFNNSGKVVAFSGRLLPGNEYGPKYLNSSESSIYQKRNSLYGLYQAKGAIRKADLCILLEGNTDVISMHRIGFTNSIAPLGTGLTKEQLTLIKNYTNNILFLFDADNAGQIAVERSFYLALEQGFVCYSTNTGDFKDVDDLIKSKPEEISKLVENRTDTFSYLLSRKIESIGAESLKSINYLSRYVLSFLNKVTDETSKSFYIAKAKQIIPKLVLESNQSLINNKTQGIVKGETLDIEDMFIKSILELNSLKQLIELDDGFLKNEANIALLIHVQKLSPKTTKELYDSTEGTELRKRLEHILLSNAKSEDLDVLRKRLTIRNIETEIQNMRIRLAIAEEKEDTSQINELLKTIMDASNNLKKYKDEDIKL